MMYEENYDELFDESSFEEVKPQRRENGNGYPAPSAQTELGKQFDQYFVKAYKQGEKPFCEDFRDIDKACSRASYLHFREEWGTRVIAVNLQEGTAAELRWQGKDVGYGIHSQS